MEEDGPRRVRGHRCTGSLSSFHTTHSASGWCESSLEMADFSLTPSAAPPRREYVLLISGTMNPPHCGHIRLGLHAARRRRGRREAEHHLPANLGEL